MKRYAVAVVCWLGLMIGIPAARAQYPSYLILRAPAVPATGQARHHGRQSTSQAGHVRVVEAQPYAYGWFGACPATPQWSRHFGYYRNYTEWSAR